MRVWIVIVVLALIELGAACTVHLPCDCPDSFHRPGCGVYTDKIRCPD